MSRARPSRDVVAAKPIARTERLDFSEPLPQEVLDIRDRVRGSVFPWRGQFSPQLVEALIGAYCPPDSVVLDPFVGSGTVLREAAAMSLSAVGFEINPSAWAISRLNEFASHSGESRAGAISEVREALLREFPIMMFAARTEMPTDALLARLRRVRAELSEDSRALLNALVIVLDLFRNRITPAFIHDRFAAVSSAVSDLPYSRSPVRAELRDARDLSLADQSVDFVVTSPPYINVFNYHQNYRRSVEVLGWNVLRVARSEIGANRANRGNRFRTVTQYCVDMAMVLAELARVLRPSARAMLIVGYQSNVLGAPFFNADIVERIADEGRLFRLVLRQRRAFTSRYGQNIREDVLHLLRTDTASAPDTSLAIGREVASDSLRGAVAVVPKKNARLLDTAIAHVGRMTGTPIFAVAGRAVDEN